MSTIVTFIVVLGFLIFIHELGHFLAARAVGVQVQEFSIGFPPRIASKEVKGTRYSLSWLPLGGFVKLKGQNLDDEDPTDPENYAAKSISQRLLILVAGAGMNLIGAFMLMPLVYMIGFDQPAVLFEKPLIGWVEQQSDAERIGIQKGDLVISLNDQATPDWQTLLKIAEKVDDPYVRLEILRNSQTQKFVIPREKFQSGIGWQMYTPADLGDILDGSPAEKAGLQEGDRILQINGNPIEDWHQLTELIRLSKGENLQIKVQRGGSEVDLSANAEYRKDYKTWVLGISTKTRKVNYGFFESVQLGSKKVVDSGIRTFAFLGQLISGNGSKEDVGGPIMIAKIIGQAAQKGAADLFGLISFISLQLAIFNLLPIPALDGGHIFFLLIEKIKGGSLSPVFREKTQMIGFFLLILLMVYVTIQDSIRLFQ